MSPILGIWASQISGRLWEPQGAYDALSTVTVPSGGVASIEFAGIPTGYKHLQIRGIVKSSLSTGYPQTRINNDTGNNYNNHLLWGDGSTAQSYGPTTSTLMDWLFGLSSTTQFSAFVVDVLDYASSNKFKTIRSLHGMDANGSGEIRLSSGLWRNTAAITSINIFAPAGTFTQYSQFTLYGIR